MNSSLLLLNKDAVGYIYNARELKYHQSGCSLDINDTCEQMNFVDLIFAVVIENHYAEELNGPLKEPRDTIVQMIQVGRLK